MRSLSLCASLAALIAAFPASAAAPRKKVAVLDVRTVGAFDPKTVQGLSTLVASEAEKAPVKVIGSGDIAALIGFDKQKQLLGCSENSCLAEIGGALGVDYLLTTEVSEVGGIWLLSSVLLDVGKSQAVKRVTKKAGQLRDLIDLAQQATTEALAVLGPPEPLPERKEASRAAATPAPGEKSVSPSTPTSTRRIVGIGLDVAGGLLLAGGVTCGILALGKYNDAKSLSGQALEDAKSSGKTTQTVANVLYGASALTLGIGLYLTFTGGSDAPAATVSASPLPGGGALTFAGRF